MLCEAPQSEPPAAGPAPALTVTGFHLPDRRSLTLDAFLDWMMTDAAQPEASFAQPRIRPEFVEGSDVLLLTDMPSATDMTSGRLFTDEDGELIHAMLRACGIAPSMTGRASLLLARPPGGMGDERHWQQAAERQRLLLSLARPRLVLMFGDKTNRALCEATRGETGVFDIPVNLGEAPIHAIALPALFVLLQQPERKAAAWKDLRRAVAAR